MTRERLCAPQYRIGYGMLPYQKGYRMFLSSSTRLARTAVWSKGQLRDFHAARNMPVWSQFRADAIKTRVRLLSAKMRRQSFLVLPSLLLPLSSSDGWDGQTRSCFLGLLFACRRWIYRRTTGAVA